MSVSSNAYAKGGSAVATGAAIGAIAGTFIPIPGIGTAIGAGIGAQIGGVVGALGLGSSAKKAAKRATAYQIEREENVQEANYLAMLRTARVSRASSLAAASAYDIATSSLATSALSSIGSQSQYSVNYTANDQRLIDLIKQYQKKAGTLSKVASDTMKIGQVAGTALTMYGLAQGAGAAGTAASTAAKTQALKAAGSTGMGVSGATLNQIGSAAYSQAFTDALKSSSYLLSLPNLITSFGQQALPRY